MVSFFIYFQWRITTLSQGRGGFFFSYLATFLPSAIFFFTQNKGGRAPLDPPLILTILRFRIYCFVKMGLEYGHMITVCFLGDLPALNCFSMLYPLQRQTWTLIYKRSEQSFGVVWLCSLNFFFTIIDIILSI